MTIPTPRRYGTRLDWAASSQARRPTRQGWLAAGDLQARIDRGRRRRRPLTRPGHRGPGALRSAWSHRRSSATHRSSLSKHADINREV